CAGGFDLVIVIGVPPSFVSLTAVDAVAPMRSAPKYVAARLTDRCAPGAADAEMGTLTFAVPGGTASVFNPTVVPNTPGARGVNVTVAPTDAPGASRLPVAGTPETEKFEPAAGSVRPVTCNGPAPTFVYVKLPVIGAPPMAAPPRLNCPGNTERSP